MDVNAFQVFRVVAAEGSVTKAAERLNYVQSNVTARIQQLEKELGVPLFYRDYRKMTLTPHGHILLQYANKVVEIVTEAKEVVKDSSIPTGALCIGSMESTAAVWLPQMVSEYHRKYPEVDLNVTAGPTEVQLQAVLDHRIDGAFVDGPVSHPDLVSELDIDERLVVVSSSASGQRGLEAVVDEPLLMPFARCVYLDRWKNWLSEQGRHPSKVMEFGTIDGILGCIENGFGVTVLPHSLVRRFEAHRNVQCHAIAEPHCVVPTVLVRRRDSYMTVAFRAFLDVARKVVHTSNHWHDTRE